MISNTPVIIGHRSTWGGEIPFVLQPEDARFHTYIIGKTGSGKTTLLRNLNIQHIHRGHGVAVINPHGDLAEDLLKHIPPRRADDLVYFDPADLEFPIASRTCRWMNGRWWLLALWRRSRPFGATRGDHAWPTFCITASRLCWIAKTPHCWG